MIGKYDLPADVFSFGIVITEALAGTEAQNIIEETRTRQFGLSLTGLQSFMGDGRPPVCRHLVNLAHRCCNMIPSERPVAEELCRSVQGLASDSSLFCTGVPAQEPVVEASGTVSRRPGSGSGRGSVAAAWNMHIKEMILLSSRVRDGTEFATL